jgi:hypothetical protein
MKASIRKLAQAPQTGVFPKAPHRLRANPNEAAPSPKSQKRDNIFSKSRDTREDRGERQIKTSHSAQTFSHGGR